MEGHALEGQVQRLPVNARDDKQCHQRHAEERAARAGLGQRLERAADAGLEQRAIRIGMVDPRHRVAGR